MAFCVRRGLTWLVVVATLMTVPGCWDYQRINFRSALVGVAVDPVDGEESQMKFTFQVPEFSGSSSAGGQSTSKQSGGSGSKKWRNFSAAASGLDEAVAKIQMISPKALWLGDLQVVIFNLQCSDKHIQSVISELIRNPTSDKDAYVLMSKGSAQEVMHGKGRSASDELSMKLREVKQHGYTSRIQLWQVWRDTLSSGIDPHVGVVEMENGGRKTEGMVCIKHMKPVVVLDRQDTLGYNFAEGEVNNISVQVMDSGSPLVIGQIKSRSSLKPTFGGEHSRLGIEVHVSGAVVQDPSMGMTKLTREGIRKCEQISEEYIKANILRTLKKLQDAHTDTYGFGRKIVLKNPRLESQIQQHWDDWFSTAQPEVQVNVILRDKGGLV